MASILDEIKAEVEAELSQQHQEEKPASVLEDVKQEVAAEQQQAPVEEPKTDFFESAEKWLEPTPTQKSSGDIFLGLISNKRANELDDEEKGLFNALSDEQQYKVAQARKDIPLDDAQARRIFEVEKSKMPSVPTSWEDWYNLGGDAWDVVKNVSKIPIKVGLGAAEFGRDVVKATDMTVSDEEAANNIKKAQGSFYSFMAPVFELPESVTWATVKAKEGGLGWADAAGEKLGLVNPDDRFERWKGRRLVSQAQAEYFREHPTVYGRMLDNPLAKDALSYIAKSQMESPEELAARSNISVEEAKAQQDAMAREQIDNLTSKMESELPEEKARVRIAGEFLLPGELGMGTMGAVSAVAKAGTGIAKGLKYIGKSADEIAEINKAAQALQKSKFAEMLKKRTERAEAVAKGAGKVEKAIEGLKPAAEKVNKVLGNITAPVLGGVAGYSVAEESPVTGILSGVIGGVAARGVLKGTKVGLEIPTFVREVAEARKVAPLGKTFETLGKSAEGSALKAKILSRGGKTIDNILSNSVEYAKSGIHGTTLALATGALESADPEEMKQMLADGLAITLGGRALQHIKGKMMGNDPIIEQRERISDDSRIHRRYQEADPETQANLDQISDFDNAISARQTKLNESESDLANLMAAYKGSAEDAKKIKLAQSEVEKNKIALDQVKRANVQTRNEFGREFLKTYANLQDITNGVLKTGQNNVGFNILSTDQIYQKLRNDPANSNVPDADLAQMASQAGFYSSPSQQGVVFDRRRPSIVLNADSIRERIKLFGESPTEALVHESSHFMDVVPEFQEALSGVRSMLFQNEIRDAAGNIKATTPGIFSKAKLVELFNDGYLRHLDPQGKEAFAKLNKLWDESRGQLDENKVANYMKSEVMADLLGEISSRHLSKDLDSATLAMWDRARIKAKKNLLDRAINRFYGLGGRGDIVTAANTRAEFPPEAMAAARDAMRQIVALNGEISPPVQEPDMPKISRSQMMKNSALIERFGKDSPLFKTEFKVKVFDKDKNQVGESVPVATPNPSEGTFQNTDVGMKKLSGYGDIPAEAQGLQVPEGGTLVVSRDLVMEEDGVTPVTYEPKDARKIDADRKKLITEALDTDDYGTPNRFEPVEEGSETYRGTFTPLQIQAIKDMPESLVPKKLKEHMLKVNDAIARGDGTRFIVDYAAVMNDNGKYQAFSPKMYDLVPIGMHLSSKGNFLVTTISVGRIFDKMRLWNERMPGRLRFWDNNLERTFDDFVKYLKNWEAGKPGKTDLDADPKIAEAKAVIFNDLLNLYDKATEYTNLERTKIPRRKGDPRGKDPNRTIMSIRVDHIAELLPNENATKLPVNYGFAKINFMPERMESEATTQQKLQFMPERPVDQVAAEQGFNVKAYHGTSRADRVGNRFRKTRATSGPMAFFTSDPNIAENYAKGKADTSIEPPEDYRDWFKFKPAGSKKEVNISDAWYSLTPEQRSNATEKLYTTGYENADESTGAIIPNAEFSIAGKDSIDYELRKARGNALEAAKELWLTSGTLFNDEVKFTEVLKSLGVDARFDDPFAKNPKVYDVFLKIQNPLVTSEIPENVMEALRANAKKQRKPSRQFGADAWDKRTVDAKDWIAELDADYAAGRNSFAWTRIPDWVTDTLKSFGYDSIQDTGGKMGGEGHDVYIPFEENQIKSAAQETFTDAGKKIPMEKRFSEKPDIRFMPERPAEQERIVAATYTDPRTGEVREGVNHKTANPNAPDEQTDRESRYYGFKTDAGRVVDREEAYRIAEASGQLKEATSEEDRFNADRGVLHSNMVEMKPTIGEKTEISPKIGERPTISEKPQSSEMIGADTIKPADLQTSAKPEADAVIKPFSNALVSSAGLINFLPAYHGTPFEVDKFKLANIGTGEGAQAYGWGLYFAQAKAVAEEYKKRLSGDVWRMKYKDGSFFGEPYLTEQEAKNDFNDLFGKKGRTDIEVVKVNENAQGNLYKVDIDVKDEDLLDWDKPLSEQPESVRDSLIQLIKERNSKEIAESYIKDQRAVGGTIYGLISDSFGESAQGTPEKRASEALLAAGIPGIRYLDQKSRATTGGNILGVWQGEQRMMEDKGSGKWFARVQVKDRSVSFQNAPTSVTTTSMPFNTREEAQAWAEKKISEGTYNYVVFDENLITILDKNDKPVAGELPKQAPLAKGENFEVSKSGDVFVDDITKPVKFTKDIGLQFMPARPEVNLEDYIDKPIIALTADRMGIGKAYVGPKGAEQEVSQESQGGPGFSFLYTDEQSNPVWGFTRKEDADRFVGRVTSVAKKEKSDSVLVAPTLLSPDNHLHNPTGQLGYATAIDAAIKANMLDSKLADSHIEQIMQRIAGGKALPKADKDKFSAIKSLAEFTNAVKAKEINFRQAALIREKASAKTLPISVDDMTRMGILPSEVAKNLSHEGFYELPTFSVVSLFEVPANSKPEQGGYHYAYPWIVRGKAIGFLKNIYNLDKLTSATNVRSKTTGELSAQPVMVVMPQLDPQKIQEAANVLQNLNKPTKK